MKCPHCNFKRELPFKFCPMCGVEMVEKVDFCENSAEIQPQPQAVTNVKRIPYGLTEQTYKERKEIKKLLIALLLVLSCVLLFACVQSGPVTDTTAPSDESTPYTTDAPTEAPTQPAKSGCGSALGFAAVALLTAAAAFVARKKN